MHYELYLDIFFIQNWLMDYILLRLVNEVLKYGATRIRSLLASMIGAIGMCLIVLLPTDNIIWNALLTHIVLNTIMVKTGFKIKSFGKMLRGVFALYFVTFVFGGMIQMLIRYTKYTFIVISFISYILIQISMKVYERLKVRGMHMYEITLYVNQNSKTIKGLYDTGNQLTDPYTRKPVHIVNQEIIEEMFRGEGMQEMHKEEMEQTILNNQKLKLHYIPYQSLGNTNGCIPVITIDYLYVKNPGSELLMQKPMIALAKENVSSDNRYQMILNPSQMNE